MTREEAIAVLEESKRQNEIMRDNPSTFWASHQMADGVKNAERRIAALDLTLSALRPVSRERVERMTEPCEFCGEWIGGECTPKEQDAGYKIYAGYIKQVAVDDFWEDEIENLNFCPVCGRPMTDEAVQTVMERLEALKDGNENEN